MLCSAVLDLAQNMTIEERVAMLEIQVVEIEEDLMVMDEDITTLGIGLEGLGENVDFLFDEQVIQDERLLSLEQENDVIDEELESKFSTWPSQSGQVVYSTIFAACKTDSHGLKSQTSTNACGHICRYVD